MSAHTVASVHDRARGTDTAPDAQTREECTPMRSRAQPPGGTQSDTRASGDRLIRHATAAVVILVAGIAAYVSYQHTYDVVRAHGENPGTARLVPLTLEGLVFASSMVLLHCARHRLTVPPLAYGTLALGIAATLAGNIAYGLEHGPIGAVIAAWPAAALVLAYELLMWLIHASGDTESAGTAEDTDRTAVPTDTADTMSPDTDNAARTRTIPADNPDRRGLGDTDTALPLPTDGGQTAHGPDGHHDHTVAEPAWSPSDEDQADKLAAARALAAQLHREGHRITRKALRDGTEAHPGLSGPNGELTELARQLRDELTTSDRLHAV